MPTAPCSRRPFFYFGVRVKTTIALATVPPNIGLKLNLDDIPVAPPFSTPAVVGLTRSITAPDQVIGGIPYRFVSWSDGGAQSHIFNAPDVPTTYVATFAPAFTPGDNANFVAQNFPVDVFQGSTNPASITMVNIGSTTWSAANNYFLAAINPADNLIWSFNRVALSGDVAPGNSNQFNFFPVAPLVPSTYNFQWQMIRDDGTGLFGTPSSNVAVVVTPFATRGNSATFVSQVVPLALAPGASATAYITMRNTGSNTWSESDRYRLGSMNPQDNGTWNLRRGVLANPVRPGETYTFAFTIRAPLTLGNYNFQWEMVRETVERFPDLTPNVVIKVVNTPPPDIAPAFTINPTDRTVAVGQTIPFTAAATGNPTPSLRWQSQPPGAAAFTDVPGATTANYTTPPLALADSGAKFQCIATNSVGSVTSFVATITVTNIPDIAPVFTLNPVSRTLANGNTAAFTASATGRPTPAFRWQSMPPGAPDFADIPGAIAANYTTPLLAVADSGTQFKCIATNVAGSVTSLVATVTVTNIPDTAPIFTASPASRAVTIGQSVAFSVGVTGQPAPTLRWQTQPPGAAAFADIPGASAANYTTAALALADSGAKFQCIAANTAGSVTSAVATVTVTSGATTPYVTRFFPAKDFRNVPVGTVVTVTFSQAMQAATITTATFKLVRPDLATTLAATVTYDPATFTATLRPTLPLKANWKHNVNLTSAITSAAGVPIAATNSYFYSLDTQPPTFSNIAASQISRTGASIVWTSNEISSSQVRYGLAVPYSAASAINAAQVRQHSVALTGLTPGKLYHFQVRSTDPYNNTGTSGDFTFTTLP
jgi:hypothetical protein